MARSEGDGEQSTGYWDADAEALALLRDVIARYRRQLEVFEIRLVMCGEIKRPGCDEVWAASAVVGGVNAYLAGGERKRGDDPPARFGLIRVNATVWEEMDQGSRTALLHHEVCHFSAEATPSGEVKLALRSHDLEEFREVVEEHGLWRDAVERFAATLRRRGQLDLFAGQRDVEVEVVEGRVSGGAPVANLWAADEAA